MDGLIIHKHWLNKIFSGEKTWEIRGTKTSKRGKIALIQKGSGEIFGTCELAEVIGPLSRRDLEVNRGKHQLPSDDLSVILEQYTNPYAWVLSDVKRFDTPIPYNHPRGAVIWVKVGNLK